MLIYFLIVIIGVVAFTGFTGMGLSLGRTKLFYNNFEIEDEVKEEIPEYKPDNIKSSVKLDMKKDEIPVQPVTPSVEYRDNTQSSMINNMLDNDIFMNDTSSVVEKDMYKSSLHPPDQSPLGLTEEEQKVVQVPPSKIASQFLATDNNVYEELNELNFDLDFGFGEIGVSEYNTEDTIDTLAENGLNYVHG